VTRTTRPLFDGLVIGMLLMTAPLSGLASDEPTKPDPTNPALIARGKVVYAEQCASCHGANLEGQPNWRHRLPNGRLPAPPHDASGHTWHHSDRQLFDMTKIGPAGLLPGYQSDMPGFKDILSDADIWAVLSYIESTWPTDIRERQQRFNQNKSSGTSLRADQE
jgi:mono/diheme cytochrome c family protein